MAAEPPGAKRHRPGHLAGKRQLLVHERQDRDQRESRPEPVDDRDGRRPHAKGWPTRVDGCGAVDEQAVRHIAKKSPQS